MTPLPRTYCFDRVTMRAVRLGAIVCVALVLSSCSGNSFLARKFDDFTAHYNKFYNANRTFQEQERRLQSGDEKIDTDQFLSTYELPKQRGRSAEFEKVITKCADLLRNHPRSKWVDDALMLIGKSYFYQRNFVGAEQKFNEIINLNGNLKDEAEFWLARTLVAGQSSTAAEEIIGAALAEEDLDKEWRARFLLLRGDLRTEVGRWESAVEDIEEGLEHVDNGDTAARAFFLLGQLHEKQGNYEQAVRAYNRAQRKKPLYELSYAAMVGEIRVLGLYVDSDKALAKLESAMRENKHFQNRYHLQYLHARTLAADGDPVAARESFFGQLYPSDPTRKTSLRGEVHYRLAELYRDYLSDFYAAGVHFDTASSVLRSPPAQNEEFAPDAITDAREMAATFQDYRETLDQVARMDSLLYLGSLDKAAFDSAVAAVRIQLAEEAARIQEELERRRTESRFRQAASSTDTRTPAGGTQTTDQATAGTFGFLNHKNLQRVQEAYLSFKEIWGDRPLVPGWRREEAVVLAQRQAQAEKSQSGEVVDETGPAQEVRFLPPVDLSEVPRDSTSKAQMRAERAQARYRLANVLFLSIGLPDSAAKWYRVVIDQDSEDPVAHRALYAMAEVHEALGDEAAAVRTLERVIERYPNSEFADRARTRLGLEVQSASVAADTLQIATSRYEDAYAMWKRRDYAEAIDAMVRVAADFPERDIAAKALLATARIFLEKAHRDGDDFYGVIQVGDSVFTPEEVSAAIAAAAPPPADTTAAPPSDTTFAPPADTTALPPPDTTPALTADVTAQPPGNTAPTPTADTTAPPLPDTTPPPTADVSPAPTDSTARAVEREVADAGEGLLTDTLSTPPMASGEAMDAEIDTGAAVVQTPQAEEVLRKNVVRDREDEQLMVKPDQTKVLRDDLAARRDAAVAQRTNAGVPTDTLPANPPGANDSTLADVSSDTVAPAVGETIASAVDTVVAETARSEDPGASSDSSAAVAAGQPEKKVDVQPPVIPEIDWGKPDYFIEDLIPVPMTVHSLYASVTKHFPRTPYGEHAAELRQGLEAVRTALAVAELEAERAGDDALDKGDGQAAVEQSQPAQSGDESNEGSTTAVDAPGPTPSAPDSSAIRPPPKAPQPVRQGDP